MKARAVVHPPQGYFAVERPAPARISRLRAAGARNAAEIAPPSAPARLNSLPTSSTPAGTTVDDTNNDTNNDTKNNTAPKKP